jgi:starch phosphorylase
MDSNRSIAYFSMEIAVEAGIPTYAGGLGILAGDTVRAAADLRIPMVAVTLLHREGYFYQRIGPDGRQTEEPVAWAVEDYLTEVPARVTVELEGRPVAVRAWRYKVRGVTGHVVPVYFLDTRLPENDPEDRALTDHLYGGDNRYRLKQEAILGIGGVRMLRTLGDANYGRFHMNEGHAAFLALELLDEHARDAGRDAPVLADVHAVRERCVFTTHTPVPAGHDKFPVEMVQAVIGDRPEFAMSDVFCCDGEVNMTFLALNLSRYVNGVAKKHGEVARHMFTAHTIDSITNGVHMDTWIAAPFQELFDRHIPGWREDNFSLRYALSIPKPEIWHAHHETKRILLDDVNRATNAGLEVEAFTIGFARRMTPYKRPDLLFRDLDRLRAIATGMGPLQVICAGKAHPGDKEGKAIIRRITDAAQALAGDVKVVFVGNYDMAFGKRITAGVDLWLNTPQPPMEASGTSGMKAAANGVPSLSVLDGWWLEGCIEGVTGWAIGENHRNHDAGAPEVNHSRDAEDLLSKLEKSILPAYYQERDRYLEVMRHAIALNASFFNTQRMMQQYVLKAYFL